MEFSRRASRPSIPSESPAKKHSSRARPYWLCKIASAIKGVKAMRASVNRLGRNAKPYPSIKGLFLTANLRVAVDIAQELRSSSGRHVFGLGARNVQRVPHGGGGAGHRRRPDAYLLAVNGLDTIQTISDFSVSEQHLLFPAFDDRSRSFRAFSQHRHSVHNQIRPHCKVDDGSFCHIVGNVLAQGQTKRSAIGDGHGFG